MRKISKHRQFDVLGERSKLDSILFEWYGWNQLYSLVIRRKCLPNVFGFDKWGQSFLN